MTHFIETDRMVKERPIQNALIYLKTTLSYTNTDIWVIDQHGVEVHKLSKN